MVRLTAARDISGIPIPRAAGPAAGPTTEAAAGGGGGGAPARVELRAVVVDEVEVALRGQLGCRDAATLSCKLHRILDGVPTMITVDARAVTGHAPGVADVLIVAAARACADHVAWRVIDPEGRLRPDDTADGGTPRSPRGPR